MQGYSGMIDKTAEKFQQQVDVKITDPCPWEINSIPDPRTPGEIYHDPGKRLIQRNIGMTIAYDPLFVANGSGEGLAQGNAHILDRVMRIDLQITVGLHLYINLAVPRNLIQHMFQKRDPGFKRALALPVQVHGNGNTGFQGVSLDFSVSFGHFRLFG